MMSSIILRKTNFNIVKDLFSSKLLRTSSRSMSGKSQDEFVEGVVCKESEIGENEMKVFNLGEEGKVLLAKQDGKVFATGTLCSHYKAPLVTGALGKGKVRCPWHGACFNLATGDIEDFPGLDSIPSYEVKILNDGGVQVRAKKSDLDQNKRVKGMCKQTNKTKNYVVVGGGAAAAKCVETLRQEGCDGQIIMVCKEAYNPYDRIKVTKVLDASIAKFQLRSDDFYKENDIEVKKGVAVLKVGPTQRQVHLSNGETINFEKLFIATGSTPRKLRIPGVDLGNVLTMRNLDDTITLKNLLGSEKNKHVVISGSSFVAMESAALSLSKAQSVTVVMRSALPLQLFGTKIAERIATMFQEKDAKLLPNTSITKLEGSNNVVTDAVLSDGSKIPADIVILAVGSTFNTEFLQGSNISVDENGSIPTDEYLETSVKHVYAGGDIAYAPVMVNNNQPLAIGHWQLAQYHGHIAAKNMLGLKVPLQTVPFFWANFLGKALRYTGHCAHPDDIIIDGELQEMKFTAYFCEGERVKAVVSTSNVTAAFAEYLSAGNILSKAEVQADPSHWLTQVPMGKI